MKVALRSQISLRLAKMLKGCLIDAKVSEFPFGSGGIVETSPVF